MNFKQQLDNFYTFTQSAQTMFIKQLLVISLLLLTTLLVLPLNFGLGLALSFVSYVYFKMWANYLTKEAPITHTIAKDYSEVLNVKLDFKGKEYNLNISQDSESFYISVKDYGVNLTRFNKAIQILPTLYFIM